MLTIDIFLATWFGTLALVLGLLIPLLLLPMKDDIRDIKESVKPLKEIDEEAHRLGIREYMRRIVQPIPNTEEHQSLPPEKAQRKEELLYRGQFYGLDPNEAEELKRLLNEETWNDFAAGLIGIVAAIGLIALIAIFIDSVTRRR